MSFMVQSKVDSRTILGEGGAEQLLGHGDMLFLPPGGGVPTRVHGAFVSDEEVHRVVADWKQRGEPVYIESVTQTSDELDMGALNGQRNGAGEEDDALYDEAVRFVCESRKASISSVQRKLRIGYNRAARMIESMEVAGVVSEMSGNGAREVIAPPPPRD
jgi:S-DNA-T family DNA segregation ATPase FtsK/SpoIIIE